MSRTTKLRPPPRGALWVAAAALGGCAAPYVMPPLQPGHPASVESAETPLPPPSQALSADPIPLGAQDADLGHGHGSPSARHEVSGGKP